MEIVRIHHLILPTAHSTIHRERGQKTGSEIRVSGCACWTSKTYTEDRNNEKYALFMTLYIALETDKTPPR